MKTQSNGFDEFLAGVEKQARKARLGSIVITILTVIMAAVFLYLTYSEITKAQEQLKQVQGKTKEEEDKLEKLKQLNEELSRKNEELKSTITAIDKSSKSEPTSPVVEDKLTPRIYLHIIDELQMGEAKRISVALQEKNKDYIVQGVEIVNVPLSWRNSEVRYFRKDDENEAVEIAGLLKAAGVKDAVPQFVGRYKKVSPKQYEVWFSDKAFNQR